MCFKPSSYIQAVPYKGTCTPLEQQSPTSPRHRWGEHKVAGALRQPADRSQNNFTLSIEYATIMFKFKEDAHNLAS